MKPKHIKGLTVFFASAMIAILAGASQSRADTVASLLGNFTINQYCGLLIARDTVDVRYTVVYGQLPALRELHNADMNGDGVTSQAERDAYVGTLVPGFIDGLELMVDGARVPLRAAHWTTSLPTEQGGFSLRVDVGFTATLPASADGGKRSMKFVNANYPGKMGWHEIVVASKAGVEIFDTDAYNTSATNGLTEALQALPAAGPLDERTVHMGIADGGMLPGARPLGPRPQSDLPTRASGVDAPPGLGATENAWIARKTKQLIDAISGPTLEPKVAFWALLAALILGSVHALSPGHGKTIVGAYLIGSRGTPRHALFLGLTVTVTHTIGVFLLGFATLYASRFIVPERLFPILSMVSALLVLGMGLVLLLQRARAAIRVLGRQNPRNAPAFFAFEALPAMAGSGRLLLAQHSHPHHHEHSHTHADGTMHSHGGGPMHSHLPPGAAGEKITLKSLITLGISGGLVPCPSALVLLLAAIALHKTAYGMLLVLVFSVGLAITLTIVGLAFLYARNKFRSENSTARWPQLLPVLSAATITVVGMLLCVGALKTFS